MMPAKLKDLFIRAVTPVTGKNYAGLLFWCLLISLVLTRQAFAAPPVVIEPAGNNDRIAAGVDFATYELGDPWDMDQIEDIFSPNSVELADETIINGIYTFRTVEQSLVGKTKAQFWLIFPGLENTQRLVNEERNPGTGQRLFTREKFPIDTSVYKYFTARVRMSSATSVPLTTDQPFVVYYFENATSIGNSTFGLSSSFKVPPNQWTIVNLNLETDVNVSSPESWSFIPFVEGLRIDPTNLPDVKVEIDWIRLTASPMPEQNFNVSWGDNGATSYSVSARREGIADAVAFELANGVTATSTNVSLSQLPSGSYKIEVTGNGETGVSSGSLVANDVPLFSFLTPNIKGDQSLGYGSAINANSWKSLDTGDVFEVLDFETYSLNNPVGSFTGRPAGSTSRILWETPLSIDTATYRSVCFEFEVKGPRDIGAGSVAKIFWGNKRSVLTTTSPVIVQEGLNEYCVGDLANLRIDPLTSPQAENAWIGVLDFLRFDPHEFPKSSDCINAPGPATCRDIQIDSFVLAPFHSTNPNFTFTWVDSDSDDDALIDIYLDDDLIPGNTGSSVEQLVGSFTENTSPNSFTWTPPANVADGTYNVYAQISDGLNTTRRYASGPLVVGAPPKAMVTVQKPKNVNEEIVAGHEYGLRVRLNEFDMDNNELNLSRTKNISGAALAGGMFTGSGTNNNPQFVLLTTDDGDPAVDPAIFRYLTIKLRITGSAGPHFLQVFFSPDANLPSTNRGFTDGFPLDENVWTFVSFDMFNDIAGASPIAWSTQAAINGIRIDPTNKAGASFEIDWITLSTTPTASTDYQIQWTATNTGTSTFDINLVDDRAQRISVATDLSSASRTFTTNLSKLITSPYYVEVIARPGPTAASQYPILLVPAASAPGLLFKGGFEKIIK
ncbi:MAG: hypothetical protein GXP11_03260 [Gammaproteobacteria bacterium]|nr:hypothetical protein [Gammaproteobacteria bacterium]